MRSIIFTTDQYRITEFTFPEHHVVSLDNINSLTIDDWIDSMIRTALAQVDQELYVNIFIPLSFGKSLTEFLGLRFALHIRCSKIKNQLSNIFIYGTERYEALLDNEYFSVLRMKGIFLVDYGLTSLKNSLTFSSLVLLEEDLVSELNKIDISIPTNLYDSHSVANIWGMYRLLELEGIAIETIESLKNKKNSLNNIYFKWLIAKNDNKKIITPAVQKIRQEYSGKFEQFKQNIENNPKIDLSKFPSKYKKK